MKPLAMLADLKAFGGDRATTGLSDEVLTRFMDSGSQLTLAIERAYQAHVALRAEHADLLALPELELIEALQEGYINFYSKPTINPYVALSAVGPWIVTTHGAVVHDNGGYGMLGAGHAPQQVIDAMSQPWVMANVMTASFSQKALVDRLRSEIGQTRGSCPFDKFICMNSGSESVTVALRISDVNAAIQTGPGGLHEGQSTRRRRSSEGPCTPNSEATLPVDQHLH